MEQTKKFRVTKKFYYEVEVWAENKNEAQEKADEQFQLEAVTPDSNDVEEIECFKPTKEIVLIIHGRKRSEIERKKKEQLKLPSMKGYKEIKSEARIWGEVTTFSKDSKVMA